MDISIPNVGIKRYLAYRKLTQTFLTLVWATCIRRNRQNPSNIKIFLMSMKVRVKEHHVFWSQYLRLGATRNVLSI